MTTTDPRAVQSSFPMPPATYSSFQNQGPPLASSGSVPLIAKDVSAWFGRHKVLNRISLTMDPGKVTALIGPSGCGKSTFLGSSTACTS